MAKLENYSLRTKTSKQTINLLVFEEIPKMEDEEIVVSKFLLFFRVYFDQRIRNSFILNMYPYQLLRGYLKWQISGARLKDTCYSRYPLSSWYPIINMISFFHYKWLIYFIDCERELLFSIHFECIKLRSKQFSVMQVAREISKPKTSIHHILHFLQHSVRQMGYRVNRIKICDF